MTSRNQTKILLALLIAIGLPGCDAPARRDTEPSPPAPESGNSVEVRFGIPEALADRDPFTRARRLGELLPSLGVEAVPEVRETLANARFELGAVEFELLLRFWASYEPSAAAYWTFKHSSPMYRSSAARTVFEIWAEADPSAAVVAVESALAESNEDVERVAQMALVQGWFRTDREGLAQYIYGLGSGLKRQRSLFAFALALAAADGGSATARFAESISDRDARYKLEVFRQVMSALSWADVDAAARFCDANCDGPHGKGLRNVLIRTRLRNGESGGDVVEWVAHTPEGDAQQRANKQHSLWVAYATWAYRDRRAALDWMAGQLAGEPEPWLSALYGEYARQLAPDAPAEAIAWAERVPDKVDRERTLIRIARHWRTRDEAAAEDWLSRSGLSESARERARNEEAPSYLPEAER